MGSKEQILNPNEITLNWEDEKANPDTVVRACEPRVSAAERWILLEKLGSCESFVISPILDNFKACS